MNHYQNTWSRRTPARYALLGAVIAVVLLASVLAAFTTPAGPVGPADVRGTVLTGW
ncbi:hypothetical protein [Actinomadura sp. DC4]|uniref:hypothetical protein n=1 Tax=Actinomadura sp. DC4 TaxID=3055069 RepID=UPI0025B132D1|nr:hypothetical protein [Actinomadura sp. DC4]MDN3354077.1 hypothetical protein [Actinomadura sp. DC4]